MIARRAMLGGVAALAAAPALPSAGQSFETATEQMRAFMLMRGALDDRLVIGWLKGRYHGCVNGALTPLFDVVSATFSRYRPTTGGGWRGVVLEQAYFLDRVTGAWLRRFTNPYTGRTVDVPTGGYPPTMILFTPDRAMHVPNAKAGTTIATVPQSFAILGDDVTTGEVTTGRVNASNGAVSLFNETVGLHARLSELSRPDARKVRCETSYTSVKSWREWLGMGDRPGEMIATGQGLYGATPATLPAEWRAAARAHRPDLLADPGALLDPIWRAG